MSAPAPEAGLSLAYQDGEEWAEPVYGFRSSLRSCNAPHPGQDAYQAARRSLEVGESGRCRDGHPVTALCADIADRLAAAGVSPDDPGLAKWRKWNASVKPGVTR